MNHFGILAMVFSGMIAIPASASVQTYRATQGDGYVAVEGSIIDSPCAIEAGSRNQSIELKTIPISQMIHDKQGPIRPFSIRLINCVLTPLTPGKPDWQSFEITFDGSHDGDNFRLFGKAKGISLKITDEQGNHAFPGKPLPARSIESGSMTLNYGMRLVTNNQRLESGNYQTTVRFKMDYY
ncbi:type 1 fimbrial protein [Providencia stuartii]|uniref:Pilin n=1 Tax=Providencia stuartii TaxID=588 RepID=A0A1S1HU60_PROST|nr:MULTISPECIES: fimbrial protein [Providencia]ELR5302046.1 type 1 fimbrial protein [Providencia stuartii]MDW7590530.1 fimbrial protein [Providencia sp. 2023EL-00965]OHT25527.1 pilin [Providencia stuartii]